MRHRTHRHVLGVKKEHRSALVSGLAAQLLTHARIRTTLSRARALRPFVEKVITLAKKGASSDAAGRLHCYRLAIARVRDEGAVALLFKERVAAFANRKGGYTRIYKLDARRGDGAETALIELVGKDDVAPAKPKPKARKAKAPEAAAAQA
jgi:large subunit ribosomal protein L17